MTTQKERTDLTELEPWEFQYYTLHMGCTEDELKSAVASVGTCPERLRSALMGEQAA